MLQVANNAFRGQLGPLSSTMHGTGRDADDGDA